MEMTEELVLYSFERKKGSFSLKCCNPDCAFIYAPKLRVMSFGGNESDRKEIAIPLIPPAQLKKQICNFLSHNEEIKLFEVESSQVLYWNVLFYSSVLKLPYYFLDS
jgi:hypothetical protein